MNLEPTRKATFIDWLTMFLLIANTANPFLFQSTEMLAFIFVFLCAVFVFVKKQDTVELNPNAYLYVAVIVLLQVSQAVVYKMVPLVTFLGEYLRVAYALLSLMIIGQIFFDLFIRFVVTLAWISLFFYIPSILIPGFSEFLIDNIARHFLAPFVNNFDGLYDYRENLIIFNFEQIKLGRNSGFYWEPGVHGGFLTIALFLNLIYKRTKLLTRQNIILIVVTLTTLSTTSYLALIFVLLLYARSFIARKPAFSLAMLIVISVGGYFIYNELDFLKPKIEQQIESTGEGIPGVSRFASLLADIEQVSQQPLVGTGRSLEMRFGKAYENMNVQNLHRNNGVGRLLSSYGVPFFVLYFTLMFIAFKRLLGSNVNAFFAIVLLMLLGFSEDYFTKVFFITLLMYSCVDMSSGTALPRVRYKKIQFRPQQPHPNEHQYF